MDSKIQHLVFLFSAIHFGVLFLCLPARMYSTCLPVSEGTEVSHFYRIRVSVSRNPVVVVVVVVN